MLSITLFGVLFAALMFNFPVAIALGGSVMVAILTVPGAPSINTLVSSTISLSDSFPLIAVPLFVLAGDIMQTGGLSRRLVDLAYFMVGRVRAGMAYVNILASMFFAAISGSSPATVAAVGSNLIPQMQRLGYPRDFSAALTASSGMIGVLIPPSIPLIVYGVSANVSIGALFVAGIVPGLLLGLFFAITSYLLVGRSIKETSGKADLQPEVEELKNDSFVVVFRRAFWAILTPVIILGGIYGGIFTPTEAGAIAVLYAVVISTLVYRELSFKELYEVLFSSAKVSARILALVLFSIAFGRLVTIAEIPQQVAASLQALSDNPLIIIAMLNLLLLIVGMFLETISAIIILTPILLPVAVSAGMDPLVFGVMMTVNLAIGFCTPPLGVNLFVASSISQISVNKISRAILPFVVSMVMVLLITSYFPQSFLFLVELIG